MAYASSLRDRPCGDVLFFASANRLRGAVVTLVCISLSIMLTIANRVLALVEAGFTTPHAWLATPAQAFLILWPALLMAAACVFLIHCARVLAGVGAAGGFVAGIDAKAIYTGNGAQIKVIDRADISRIFHLPGLAIVTCRRSGPAGWLSCMRIIPTAVIAGGDRVAAQDIRTALGGGIIGHA